jgi:hypothetical protein
LRKIHDTCLPHYGDDPGTIWWDILDRTKIHLWSHPEVCVYCGRLHNRPPEAKKAVELFRAGQRDKAEAPLELLSAQPANTQH